MTYQPMKDVTVVEVAQYTFTPSAGAVLADWGADVIKVEHPVMGDAQRGLKIGTGGVRAGSFQPLMEHANRGKRSVGLALDTTAGHEILLDLCRNADVFLTNFLPDARRKLSLELEDIRKANSQIIYARGSGYGTRGAESGKGGFDASTFWSRMGSAWGTTPPHSPRVTAQPAGAYGDSIGGMTIAGGIAAALYARERTGQPSVVDVSLMSVGGWAMGLSLGNAMLSGEEQLLNAPRPTVNPLSGTFKTSDDRWINLTILQPGRYFADVCIHLGLQHLIGDERFDTAERLIRNADRASELIAEAFAAQPFSYWVRHLQTMDGQWAPVQSPLEIAADPQMEANGYLLPVTDIEGNEQRLVASPVQFDETPPTITRAPQFAEHTDQILRELGKDEEEIIQLKIDGVIT